MTTVELFSYPTGPRVAKTLITAKYANINATQPTFNFGVDNETAEYALNCHPLGRVPVAKTQEGYLFESNAIVRYIARLDASNALYGGAGAFEAAQVDQWMDFAVNEIEPSAYVLIGPILGFYEKNEAKETAAAQALMCVFDALNTQLEIRTFLVGERVTAADIVMGTILEFFFRLVTDKKFKEGRPHLMRYVDTCINQPNFQTVLAELAKKEAPAKKEEPKKKEDKKKEKKDDDEDAPEPGQFVESEDKKLKAILDALPPSPFVMDEFKRCYSNNDTRSVAAPFFFDKFDPAGYTCFFATYKYNDELQQQAFMTANLVGGWFQRMDALHKYLFGSVVICGDNKKQNISGFFVVRGQGLPALMTSVDDIENYEWVEVKDLAANKEKIVDYLACDGKTFATNPVMEYRIFK